MGKNCITFRNIIKVIERVVYQRRDWISDMAAVLGMGAHGEAAVDDKVGSGDERGTFGSKEKSCFADVGGHSATSERVKRSDLVGQSFWIWGVAQIFVPKASINVSRTNAVHSNVPRRQFQGQIPRQGDQPCLGACVWNGIGKRVTGMDRTDVDDRTSSVGEKRQNCLS